MIFDYLIPKLQEHFQSRNLCVETSPKVRAVFPAMHPDFGNIEIYDDGGEITIIAGNFTHGHFSNYEKDLSKEEASKIIAEDVVDFLKDVFADQIVFWSSHRGSGGWFKRGEPSKLYRTGIFGKPRSEFVWSGPLK